MSDWKKQFENAYRKYESFADPKRFIRKKQKKKAIYATFNQRSLAFVIDYFLLLIPLYYPLYFLASIFFGKSKAAFFYMLGLGIDQEQKMQMLISQEFMMDWMLNNLLSLVFVGMPLVFLWARYANTPGMWLTRIRIVNAATWGRPSTSQCIKRFIAWFAGVPIAWVWLTLAPPVTQLDFVGPMLALCVGYLWIIFDGRKQAWHDYLADTRVVNCGYWGWDWRELTPPVELEEPAKEASAEDQPTDKP